MFDWVKKIEHKIDVGEPIDLMCDLPVKKDLWLKNFVKSAVSTTLIALSINFFFNGFMEHPKNFEEILLGIIAFLLAIVVIFVIDSYHQKVREMELKSIDSNQKLNSLTEDYLNEVVEKVIKKKLKEVMED